MFSKNILFLSSALLTLGFCIPSAHAEVSQNAPSAPPANVDTSLDNKPLVDADSVDDDEDEDVQGAVVGAKPKDAPKVAGAFDAPAPAPVMHDTVPPTLKIKGFSLFNTYVVKQNDKSNGRGGPGVHCANDASSLYFQIEGRAKEIEYMYKVGLNAVRNTNPTIDQNYLQIKTPYYAFRLGNTVGPEDFAIEDASAIIGGAGGFDTAAYESVYNLSAGALKGNDNIMDTNKATKIVFIGPDYKGLQFFAAYTPNTAHQGDGSKSTQFPDNSSIPGNTKGIYPEKAIYPFGTNNWAFAVNYKITQGLWKLALTGATVTETSHYTITSRDAQIKRKKLRSGWVYQLGAVAGYDRWELGLGFLDNKRARLPKEANMALNASGSVTTGDMHLGNAGKAWNAGLGYTVGAYEFAGAYQHSWRKTDATNKATTDVWTGTIDFNIFQGWKAYVEVDFVRSKTNLPAVQFANAVNNAFGKFYKGGVGNNSGTVAIVGTKISF